jgi:hypothetical protein
MDSQQQRDEERLAFSNFIDLMLEGSTSSIPTAQWNRAILIHYLTVPEPSRRAVKGRA